MLYARRDVVAASDAFNARTQPPLFQREDAAHHDRGGLFFPDDSRNENKVSLLAMYDRGNAIHGNLVR